MDVIDELFLFVCNVENVDKQKINIKFMRVVKEINNIKTMWTMSWNLLIETLQPYILKMILLKVNLAGGLYRKFTIGKTLSITSL